MDNGTIKVFRGYRVQYNTARGPAKGGLRWHPDETIDTVRALAAWMNVEDGCGGYPSGRGEGRSDVQPQGDVRQGKAAPGPGLYPGRGKHTGSFKGCTGS